MYYLTWMLNKITKVKPNIFSRLRDFSSLDYEEGKSFTFSKIKIKGLCALKFSSAISLL